MGTELLQQEIGTMIEHMHGSLKTHFYNQWTAIDGVKNTCKEKID